MYYYSDILNSVPSVRPSPEPVLLFPNPANNRVQVSSVLPVQNLVLLNSNGQQVAQTQWQRELSLEGLARGVYLLQVHTADGSQHTQRLIKR